MVNKLVAIGVGAGVVVAGVLVGRKLLGKSGEQAPAAPATVDLGFAKTAADAVAAQKGLRHDAPGEEGKLDRLRYFFLHRRAVELGLADATLRVAPGLAQLQTRIARQLGLVEPFVASLVGTAQARKPYFGAPDDPAKPIHHLELGLHVHVRDIDPPITSEAAAIAAASPNPQEAQTLRELDARRMRTSTIVWRAAAIDAELWAGTGDTATLREAELTKLLDRRLRAVERLHYEVSAGATQDRLFQDVPFNKASPHEGPWTDGFLVHAFERPSLPRSARSDDGSWAPEAFILGLGTLTHQLNVFDATGGSFTLVFEGASSPAIAFNASSDQVRAALRSTPGLDVVQVDCSGGPLSSGSMPIRLTGPLKPGAKLTVGTSALTGPGPDAPSLSVGIADLVFEVETEAVPRFNLASTTNNPRWYLNRSADEFDWNEWPGTRVVGRFWKLTPEARNMLGYGWNLLPRSAAQSLSIEGSPKGGTFTLSFAGQLTGELPITASASVVKKALAALPGGGPKVIVTGGPLPDAVTLHFDDSVPFNADLAVGANNLTASASGDPHPAPKVGVRAGLDGDTPGKIIDELFTLLVPSREGPPDAHHNPTTIPGFNRSDWWNRSWLHADGMMAALHIEALRFALMRHAPTGPGLRPDDEFDALPWKHSLSLDDCFELRQVTHPTDSLMGPGRNDYFENGGVAPDDLQVGDQVLFADSPVLTALGKTAWDYPTLLVTDVDTSPDKAGVNLGGLKVQGFGTDELAMPDFQLLQAGITDAVLQRVQAYIPAEIARRRAEAAAGGQPFTPPDKLEWDIGIVTRFERATGDDTVLRRWSPYGDTWDEPGPWWIWINIHTPLWRKAFGIVDPPFVDPDTDGNGVIDGDEVEPPPPDIDAAAVLARMPGALVWTPSTEEEEDADTGTNPHANTRIRFADFPNPWRATGASPILRVRADFQPPPLADSRDHGADNEHSIFIPLFQPMGGWESYFETKVKSPADSTWPSKLDPVKSDARWFTGLAKSPADPTQVRVIRPRAKPTP